MNILLLLIVHVLNYENIQNVNEAIGRNIGDPKNILIESINHMSPWVTTHLLVIAH